MPIEREYMAVRTDKNKCSNEVNAEEETKNTDPKVHRIHISVRNLVEFILRSGDLDRRRSGAEKEAMQEGSRIHRKIQGRMGSNYEAEVKLSCIVTEPRFHITVEGRADGILKEDGKVTIDEIKAVYRDIALIQKPVPVHLAQAKCYAYIYGKQERLGEMTVRMTYCQMETEQLRYFHETYSMEELEEWFDGLMREYGKWAAFQVEWQERRNASIGQIHFPFAYRNKQQELVSGVYRTIEQRRRLFIQASTGAGKTIATIYPAIQALGKGMADKFFYLTAKTITRTVATDTLRLLQEQNLQFKSIVITAKEKICFCEEAICNPDACSYAKGHFDRINDCIYELLQRENLITAQVIEKYAREYRVCPFELSLDAATWVDAVICDYNYAFDYDVCLKRFFGEGNSDEYIFLIDEAHNLVERAREMYSAGLYKEEVLALKRQVRFYSRKLEKLLETCNKKLLEWKRTCEHYEVMAQNTVGELAVTLVRLMSEMEEFLEEEDEEDIKNAVLDFYFKVRHFLNIYDEADDNYVFYKEFTGEHFYVRLFCVNPSGNLNRFLERGRAAIFFSATLLPVSYYMKLLSGGIQDYAIYSQSPFREENRRIFIGTDVSSRYTRRNEREYGRIVDYIEQMFVAKKGNYLLFFPSYVYMQAVYETFLSRGIGVHAIVQDSRMDEAAREAFLQEFQAEHSEGMAAFCVLGGIFGEGIDLRKEQLIGAVIVGTGMPQIGTERELLQRYFDDMLGSGFDYAFRYPGFNKVLQAAGRVIRTEEDKGIILLLEERLQGREYQGIFPREWGQVTYCSRHNVGGALKEFWESLEEAQGE